MKKSFIKYTHSRYIVVILSIVLLTLLLVACGSSGGGGGSSSTNNVGSLTISGVAATGAPIKAHISLKDSVGNNVDRETDSDDNGNYTFDVTGLTPPFYLFAEEINCAECKKLYSVAMGAGIANINPLTNLAVAAAAGVNDPADVYNNAGTHPIIQANLDQAIDDILDMLRHLLDFYNANVNPLTDPFTADGTGLDKVFDEVYVSITVSGVVTFNDQDGNPLGETTTTSISNPSDPVALVVSGMGYSNSGAYLIPNIDSSLLPTSMIIYYDPFTRLDFNSTSITEITAAGGTATVTGVGKVNNVDGCTFTATITDSSPDAMGIVIMPGGTCTISYNAPSQAISSGDYSVVVE